MYQPSPLQKIELPRLATICNKHEKLKIMDRKHKLTDKINKLTSLIEEKYPELYTFLDENPITLDETDDPEMKIQALEDYCDSLSNMIEDHIASHEKSK